MGLLFIAAKLSTVLGLDLKWRQKGLKKGKAFKMIEGMFFQHVKIHLHL